MGQGHSSGAGQPTSEVGYHPAALGYTKDSRKQSYRDSTPPAEIGAMRRSRIGPMRSRAKGRLPVAQPDHVRQPSPRFDPPTPRTPEWSCTLTAFPAVPPFDSGSRSRSAAQPPKLDQGVATNPVAASPNRQRFRLSGSSGRSVGGDASPRRPLSGRWTSQWEDHRGLGILRSATSSDTVEDIAMAGASANEGLHRPTTPTPQTPTNVDQASERLKRKPVPEHDFGPSSSSSPVRALARLSKRFSDHQSSDGTTSKRASEQSHFSAVTGALHQHVERLRAGPTYQIDENASHLLVQAPITPTTDFKSHDAVAQSPAVSASPPVSPSSYRRGRALSLNLMNKLKNRSRKTSDASLLLTVVPVSSGQVEGLASPGSVQNVAAHSPPVSPAHRRGKSELTLQAASQAPHSLYETARRPTRKAAPTMATKEVGAASRLASAPASSSQLRGNHSGAAARLSPRPASLASRRSSRSKRSSNASLRAAAATSKSTRQAAAVATASASTPWWNPWVRKASLGSMSFANKGQQQQPASPGAQAVTHVAADDDEAGWMDVAEDDRGLVSPVAEDSRFFSERQLQKPEKVQLPWAPAWSKRILHGQNESAAAAAAASASNKDAAEQSADAPRRNSAAALEGTSSSNERDSSGGGIVVVTAPFDSSDALHPTYNAPPPIASSSSSSFTSLAPPPTPAPVPPPRKQRRRSSRTDVLAGFTPSSSSPTSPTMPPPEHNTQAADGAAAAAAAAAAEEEERSLSVGMLRADSAGTTSDVVMATSPVKAQTGVSMVKSRPPSTTNTEARESLLSDDLDYAPSAGEADDESHASTADDLDSDATMHLYRASLVNARKARGGAGAPQVNLSPVREIMTPESRPRTGEEQPGALSAGNTFDAPPTLQQRRLYSGASMAIVAGSALVGDAGVPERRPVPAKSVVAEPHTDMASVQSASSPIGSSSLAPSTVGGPTSVSSMKKHTGPLPEALLAATAALGNRRLGPHAGDPHLRSLSSPVEPHSPQRLSATPPLLHRLTLTTSHAEGSATQQRNNRVRESWRSTDGPWSAQVTSDVKTMPAARGITRASVLPAARHQRSGSVPLAAADGSQDIQQNAGDSTEASMIVHVAADHEDDSSAVPFAETAVQASLAALQALERSEEAQAGGDWRARWEGEKLLGYSSTHLAPPNMMRRMPDDEEDQSDYSGARQRRRAEPYPRGGRSATERSTSSVDLQASRKLARARRQGTSSSSASQLYDSGMAREERRLSKGNPDNESAHLASGMVVPASPSTRSHVQAREKDTTTLETPSGVLELAPSKQQGKQRSSKTSGKRREVDESASKFHSASSRRRRPAQHGQDPSTSVLSLAKSTRSASSSSTRKGYGCDDIVAWQASLHTAALPSVAES